MLRVEAAAALGRRYVRASTDLSDPDLSRSIRPGTLKLSGAGHLFKKERENPSVPRIPLGKAGTGSSGTARAVFRGLWALLKEEVQSRSVLGAAGGCLFLLVLG